jgi:hypothetical protein
MDPTRIYVNSRDRFNEGSVPVHEKGAVIADLKGTLASLTLGDIGLHERNGEDGPGDQLFSMVLTKEEAYPGTNLTSAPDRALLRAGHAMEATHLEAEGCRITPLSLWERLVDRGRFFMEKILSDDAASILDRIQAQMAFIDRPVRVDDHTGKSYNARITGLSKTGGLMLETGNESRTIWSGSIAPLTDH